MMKKILLGIALLALCIPGTGFTANIDTTGVAQTPADGTKLFGQNAAGVKGYITGTGLKTYVFGALPSATNQIIQATGVGTFGWTSSVAGLINDTATNGDVDKLWSADKIFDSVALKENALGNPSTDTYVLSSTVAGVRSWVANGSGGMTWPAAAGIAVYSGSSTWGTSLIAPSGTIVGTTDAQTLSGKSITAVEVDGHTDISLTAAQVASTIAYNTGQAAADVAMTLPTAAAGMTILGTVGTAQANKWGVRAGATDKIYLLASDGTISAGTDNGYARMTAAQIGQSFACWSFKTDAYDWMCTAVSIGTSTFAAN